METGRPGSSIPGERARVRRRPDRAMYQREAIYEALDSGLIAHVGWTTGGQPYVTPTSYWREGDHLLWHGSSASGMIAGVVGNPVCVTVTSLEGLVIGRSGIAHSVNYRSVVTFGTPERITDAGEKRGAMARLIDRIYPGRSGLLRPDAEAELARIDIVRMMMDEASMKERSGPPGSLPADEGWQVWAGEVPVRTVLGRPVPDATTSAAGLPAPAHLDGNMRLDEVLRRAASAFGEERTE